MEPQHPDAGAPAGSEGSPPALLALLAPAAVVDSLTGSLLPVAPEADAGVSWYGLPPLEFIDTSKLKAPLMGHWATQDQAFPIASVDALDEKLKAAGCNYTGHRYLAYHAFANETATGSNRIAVTQYDAAWAQLAWDRTFAFFGRTLA